MTVTFGPQLDIELPPATLGYQVQYLEYASIHPDPDQPRTEPDAELRDSIRTNGILQPITVRRHPERLTDWMIVDGERRWRGAEGILPEIPAIVREDLDERPVRLRTQLVSNVGKPLTPLEEAQAFAELLPQYDSVAALARALGRPERTVGERLQLLELGPWIAWIQDGRLPLSHAVKVLLPLRGCPDDVHTQAIARVEKNWRVGARGEGVVAHVSLADFAQAVREAYRPAMYPLTKTKASYDRQPAFDTKRHDAECGCGRIRFALQHSERACCGNPAWWRPLDRKAKAEAPKAKAKPQGGARQRVQFHLPPGAKRIKASGYSEDVPGYAVLTGSDGRWRVADFDPTTITAAPEQLAVIEPAYGSPRVAVKADAVAEARAKWRERWNGRRQGLVGALQRHVKEKGAAYRVSGPGVAELLRELGRELLLLEDAADVHGIEVPAALRPAPARAAYGVSARDDATVSKWLGGLEEKEAAAIATTVAYLLGTRTTPPSKKVQAEIEQAKRAIEKKAVPWTKPPKAEKSAKGEGARPGPGRGRGPRG